LVPSLAIVAFDRKAHALQGIALGNTELVAVPVTLPVAKPEDAPTKRLLADCVTKYITEITEHKAAKPLAAYRPTVFEFCAVVTRTSVEDVTDEEFLKHITLVGTYIDHHRVGHTDAFKKLKGSACYSSHTHTRIKAATFS
jgi:hypothetical protein